MIVLLRNYAEVNSETMKSVTRGGEVCGKDGSFVDVTSDREACPKRWIAMLVQTNCEKVTASRLHKAGYETYVPVQQEIHQWSDRKKKVDRLVIPLIVFIRATVQDETWLRNQTYIHKLLAMPGSKEYSSKFATPIPDEQIDRMKFLLENAETEVTFVGNLKVGDAVKVAAGPLKGLEGVVIDTEDKTSVVGVLIDCLGYACVKMDKFKIEKVGNN